MGWIGGFFARRILTSGEGEGMVGSVDSKYYLPPTWEVLVGVRCQVAGLSEV